MKSAGTTDTHSYSNNSFALYSVILLATIYIISFSYLSIAQHQALRTQLRDLGHPMQALWQLTHGDWAMTLTHPDVGSRLAQHREYIFYLLAPLYYLFPSAELLLVLQSALIGLAGVLIYLLSVEVTKLPWLSFLFAALFLFNPAIHAANLYDFHAITFGCLFVPLIIYAIEKRWFWLFIVATLLVLSIKEDMALLAMFIVPFTLKRWGRKPAVILAALSILCWLINWYLLPQLMGWQRASPFWFRYKYLGNSPDELVWNVFTSPALLINRLLEPIPLQYLLSLLLQIPLAILSPLTLLAALPNAAQNLLDSTNFQSRVTLVYYSAIVITPIFIASIYGLNKLLNTKRKAGIALLVFFTITQLALSFSLSPAPHSLTSSFSDFESYYNKEAFTKISALIPKDAALSTQNNLGAQFANRASIFEYPRGLDKADYILFFIADPSRYDNGLFLRGPGFYFGESVEIMWQRVLPVFAEKNFGIEAIEAPFYLFKRGTSDLKNSDARRAMWQDYLTLLRKWRLNRREYGWIYNAGWLKARARDNDKKSTLPEPVRGNALSK